MYVYCEIDFTKNLPWNYKNNHLILDPVYFVPLSWTFFGLNTLCEDLQRFRFEHKKQCLCLCGLKGKHWSRWLGSGLRYHPCFSRILTRVFCSTASTDDPEEEISPYCETVFQTRRNPHICEVRQQHKGKPSKDPSVVPCLLLLSLYLWHKDINKQQSAPWWSQIQRLLGLNL